MAVLKSVNVGVPRTNPWKTVTVTGIDKRPVAGPVAVCAPGPKGTGAVGPRGGRGDGTPPPPGRRPARLGRALPDGVFGENLTTTGLDVDGALVGEHWRIGPDLLLEVSGPRIPCGTFEGWMHEAGWMRTFIDGARSGAYLRVLAPGELRAGDGVDVV